MICRQRLRCITCAVVALVMLPRVGFSQTGSGPTSSEWLAWKVFHDSLAYYSEHSAAALSAMLNRKDGSWRGVLALDPGALPLVAEPPPPEYPPSDR